MAGVAAYRPDVVLMDIRMPGLNGIDATERITALRDPPKVIVLTTFQLDEYVFAALRAGASGFLLKDTPPVDIIRAIRLVAAGEAMLSPSVTRTLIERFGADPTASRRAAAELALRGLTAREREVAAEVARGRSNAEIASRLYMSEATVKGARVQGDGQARRVEPGAGRDHRPRRRPGLAGAWPGVTFHWAARSWTQVVAAAGLVAGLLPRRARLRRFRPGRGGRRGCRRRGPRRRLGRGGCGRGGCTARLAPRAAPGPRRRGG